MPLQQMHVFHTAEVPVERSRKNNDRNMRPTAPKQSRNLSAELARSKVIIEHRDIDIVEELRRLLDRRGRNTLVAVLAQNRSSKMKIRRLVVEQQHPHRLNVRVGTL